MLTILIVDDEKEIVSNLHRIISGRYSDRCDILKTSISRAARDIIQTQVIDILLTDIRMPGLTGFDLAKLAKENNEFCRVIFLTGFQEFEYVFEAIKLGCDDFLLKVDSNDAILQVLEKVIISVKKEEEQREILMHAERFRHYQKPLNEGKDDPIEFIKKYIWENIEKEISLNHLAQMVFLNPSYLSRTFRQSAGVTITDYVLEVRIQLAKEMLWETDLKIQDIAVKLGIDSSAYFGRLFKKIVGCTPQEFRNQYYERK